MHGVDQLHHISFGSSGAGFWKHPRHLAMPSYNFRCPRCQLPSRRKLPSLCHREGCTPGDQRAEALSRTRDPTNRQPPTAPAPAPPPTAAATAVAPAAETGIALVRKRRSKRLWFDSVTELPQELYKSCQPVETNIRHPAVEYRIYLPHRSPHIGYTTTLGDLGAWGVELFQLAPKVAEKRRRAMAEAAEQAMQEEGVDLD